MSTPLPPGSEPDATPGSTDPHPDPAQSAGPASVAPQADTQSGPQSRPFPGSQSEGPQYGPYPGPLGAQGAGSQYPGPQNGPFPGSQGAPSARQAPPPTGPQGPQYAGAQGGPFPRPQGAPSFQQTPPQTGPQSGQYSGPQGSQYAGPRYAPPQGAPSAPPAQTPPRRPGHAMSSFFDSLRRTGLIRTEERWVGGVCGGLARRLGVDPVLVRAAAAVLSIFTGLGLVLYGLGWALMPEERDGRIHLEQAVSGDLDSGFAGAIATFVAGWALLDRGVIPTWYLQLWGSGSLASLIWTALWIGAVIAVVIAVLRWFLRRDERRSRRTPPTGTYPSPVPPGRYPTAQPGPAPQAGSPSSQPDTAPTAAGPEISTDAAQSPAPGPSVTPWSAAGVGTGPTRSAAGPTTAVPAMGASAAPSAGVYPGPTTGPTTPLPAPAAVAPRPIAPVRPRVPGPDRTLSLTVLGCMFLVLAVAGLASYLGKLGFIGGPLVAVGAIVALLGTGVLVSSLRGRRGGWMSGVGVLALLFAVPALALGTMLQPAIISMVPGSAIGPVTADHTTGPIEVGIGDVELNLRSLPADSAPRTYQVSAGVGNVRIDVTEDQDVRVITTQGAGAIYLGANREWSMDDTAVNEIGGWTENTGEYNVSGDDVTNWHYTRSALAVRDLVLDSDATAPDRTPQITVVVELGAGDLFVTTHHAQTTWQGLKDDAAWVVIYWEDADGTQTDTLPVPGMDHPAISWDDAWTCLDGATDESGHPDLYLLDQLPAAQRAIYNACVAGVLDGQTAAEASAAADASPSAPSTGSLNADEQTTEPSSPPTSEDATEPTAVSTP